MVASGAYVEAPRSKYLLTMIAAADVDDGIRMQSLRRDPSW